VTIVRAVFGPHLERGTFVTTTEINTLLEQRAGHIAEAGKIVQAARAAGRDMTAEEEANFGKLHDAADKIRGDVEAHKNRQAKASAIAERQREAEEALRASQGRRVGAGLPGATAGRPSVGGSGDFCLQYRGKEIKLKAGSLAARRMTPEYGAAFREYLESGRDTSGELQMDQSEKGGYLVPVEFSTTILASLDNTFWFRGLATVLPPTTAMSVSMPRRTSRMKKFAWGSELSNPPQDDGLKVGQATMEPGWMTGEIQISNGLLVSGIVNVEDMVQQEIVFAAGETEEEAFFTGDGVRKPLGVFTPSDDGISTARNVAGAIATDTIFDLKYSLREPYLRSAASRWLCHRNYLKGVSKLKSTTNEPLWVVSVRDNEPDRLAGVPITMSEYAPAGTGNNGTYANGNYAACLGDFRNYYILDGIDLGIQKLTELEARKNMTAYIVRRKVTGVPIHGEAFARHVIG
jgi:HK97 family phage major capsid protein